MWRVLELWIGILGEWERGEGGWGETARFSLREDVFGVCLPTTG